MRYLTKYNIRRLCFALVFILFAVNIEAQESQENEGKKVISVDPYLGQRFYDVTRFMPGEKRASPLTTYRRPGRYKTYPKAKSIELPSADFTGLSIEKVIKQRRSKRPGDKFSSAPVTLEELSQLLYSANGITAHYRNLELRAAPSAGALYPIEIYLVVNNVSGLPSGIYHYAVASHSLELLEKGDFRQKIEYAMMNQPGVGDAGVIFVFTAIPGRTTTKYDLRGWRYVYMEVGYISENLYLQATSLGLSTTAMGAFYDGEMNRLLGIDGKKEMALHVQIMGK